MYRSVWRENQSDIAVREWESWQLNMHTVGLYSGSHCGHFLIHVFHLKHVIWAFPPLWKPWWGLQRRWECLEVRNWRRGFKVELIVNFFTTLCCVWLFWPSQLLHKNQQKIYKLYQYRSKFWTDSWWERRRDRNINCFDRWRGRPSELQSFFSGASRDEW